MNMTKKYLATFFEGNSPPNTTLAMGECIFFVYGFAANVAVS